MASVPHAVSQRLGVQPVRSGLQVENDVVAVVEADCA